MDFGGPDAVVANASHWRLWPPVKDVQKSILVKKKKAFPRRVGRYSIYFVSFTCAPFSSGVVEA